jgi:hypothetical protein
LLYPFTRFVRFPTKPILTKSNEFNTIKHGTLIAHINITKAIGHKRP